MSQKKNPLTSVFESFDPSEEPSNEGYVFPCVQGSQCRDPYWMSRISFSQARQLFKPFFQREQTEQPLDLAQRTLDQNRGQKIAQYVTNGLAHDDGFYILLPIVVTIDFPVGESYEFLPVVLDEPFANGATDDLGILRLPPSTKFWIPDGQHRAFGTILALLQSPGLTAHDSIGIMLVPDFDSAKRHTIFLDANQHGVKPNQSIIRLFDHRDPYSDLARSVLTKVPIFKGRTALEATNIKPRSGDFFTMNALRESCKLLVKDVEDDREKMALRFWKAIATHHPDWKRIEVEEPTCLRQDSIAFLSITLNALAIVGNQQPDLKWVKRLPQVDWTMGNPDWDGLFQFNGRILKTSKIFQSLANYISERTV